MTKKSYALIDTANTFFRARHVASRNSDPEEKAAFALHLTLASVNQVVRNYGIDHVVFCLEGKTLKGAYQLEPTNVWDAALSFTYNMYKPGTHMCVSFTGPYKHFKLSKGGAILTDNYDAYLWFKRARYSGRRECSYHDDHFDMIGWNFYLLPELATRGLLLMGQFYNIDGTPKHNEDSELPYPDLSKFEVYTKANRE